MPDLRVVARRKEREGMILSEFEMDAITDKLEGWELIEFLQVDIQEVLLSAITEGWINSENVEDLLEFVGIKE